MAPERVAEQRCLTYVEIVSRDGVLQKGDDHEPEQDVVKVAHTLYREGRRLGKLNAVRKPSQLTPILSHASATQVRLRYAD